MTDSSTTNGAGKEFKLNDRVLRQNGDGPRGIVKSIREDSAAVSSSREEKGILVGVQWDNGSFSFFTPDSLKRAD